MKTRPTVVVDSREQIPWVFDPAVFDVVHKALPAADYSLAGAEERIAIERKTLEDFVNTSIRYRDRFGEELSKLESYEFAAVIVEASLEDVLEHRYRAGVHPSAVVGVAVAITFDYGVPVLFCSSRQIACDYASRLLLRFHKNQVVNACVENRATLPRR